MSEGLWWRKVRRNVIRDDILRTVAEELIDDHGDAVAGMLVLPFYMTAYMMADDDGVFEFSPKVFRRLTYAPSVETVTAIKNALCDAGAITNVLGGNNEKIDNFYIITDWIDVKDSSYNTRPSLTADQRRSVTARKIENEKKMHYGASRVAQVSRRNVIEASRRRTSESPAPVIQVNFPPMECTEPSATPPPPAVLNDKKEESVETENLNDTFEKNVDTHTGQDRTLQDSTGQHTAVRSGAHAEAQDNTGQDSTGQNSNHASSSGPRGSAPAYAGTSSAVADSAPDYHQQSGTTGAEIHRVDVEERIERSKKCGIYEILSGFFAGKCDFRTEKNEFSAFLLLSDLCYALSSKRNDPQMVAAMAVGQLKKMYPDGNVRPSDAADPAIVLSLAEEISRILGVEAAQLHAALEKYNETAPMPVELKKRDSAQLLAEQAIKDDGG